MIEIEDVRAAAAAVDGVVRRTPVLTSQTLDEWTGAQVFVKAESLQVGGAFKLRGAYNAISRLSPDELRRGVVAASSGNHAQAVARAASLVGTTAVILMPDDAPAVKRDATLRHGAEVVGFDRQSTDREELLRETAARTGRVVVHPFDDEHVMAGQGTAALELVEEVGDLDLLVCPVGGGGLISGSATVMAAMCPRGRTWGVEPAAGDDARQSLHAGRRIDIPVPATIADGQQLACVGALPFEVMRRHVHDIATVSDEEIVAAMRFVFEHLKLVVEPSGACALAALLSGAIRTHGRVGVVVSGGNVDEARYHRLLANGLG